MQLFLPFTTTDVVNHDGSLEIEFNPCPCKHLIQLVCQLNGWTQPFWKPELVFRLLIGYHCPPLFLKILQNIFGFAVVLVNQNQHTSDSYCSESSLQRGQYYDNLVDTRELHMLLYILMLCSVLTKGAQPKPYSPSSIILHISKLKAEAKPLLMQ